MQPQRTAADPVFTVTHVEDRHVNRVTGAVTMYRPENVRRYTSEVYRDRDGIFRWASSDNIPPADCYDKYGFNKLPGFDLAKQTAARDREMDEVLAAYRERDRNRVQSAEELAEMRNAFGPGAVVVDVISGRRTHL